jgi:hypothetical protein
MDSEMRFGNDDDAADAEGAEVMEVGPDDRGLGNFGAGDQDLFHSLDVVEEFGIAPIEFQQQVPT